MTKRKEKKLNKLSEKIIEFKKCVLEQKKCATENGKKALNNNCKQQIDFWVVQYKLTSEYIQQADEMLGQLDIIRYTSDMQKNAKSFLNCMNTMTNQFSKVFGYSDLDKITKIFDKQQSSLQESKQKTQDLIDETTSRFKEMQDSFETSSLDLKISDVERNAIINAFSYEKEGEKKTTFFSNICE